MCNPFIIDPKSHYIIYIIYFKSGRKKIGIEKISASMEPIAYYKDMKLKMKTWHNDCSYLDMPSVGGCFTHFKMSEVEAFDMLLLSGMDNRIYKYLEESII